MTLLLDTHVFLWWLDDPKHLSEASRKAIRNGKNRVYISAAVAWEIAVKSALGKLDAPDDLEDVIKVNRFLPLSITIAHALAVRSLPDHHRDPFDRILIAQAIQEAQRLTPAKFPVWYGESRLGEVSIEGAYIYPPLVGSATP